VDLDTLRAFVKVAELGSFTRAAQQLGLAKSRISTRVDALERELGSTLLLRTTRAVTLTPDGQRALERARRLVLDAEELGALFDAPRALRGRVLLDLPVNLARELVIPRLPELFAAHPELELVLSTTDRRVDVVRDGFDFVLRVGALRDSRLVARRLGALPMATCASPAYLLRYGTPRRPDELAGHRVVHYAAGADAGQPSYDYTVDGRDVSVPLPASLTVNAADAYTTACVAGLGIIQSPRVGLARHIASGELVEILTDYRSAPLPVSLVHGHGAKVPRRVRAVMDFVARLLGPYLSAAAR
jgi:DNA-binding transcriptional LysR family regulator